MVETKGTPRWASTVNGYDMFEVASALQKEIRRGNEFEAMFWALEFVPFKEKYLWERLIVISQEDIGIANLQLLGLLPEQRQLWFEFRAKGKNGSAVLILANTVLAMCRSEKSRLADSFQGVVTQKREQENLRLEIPDYALDMHTSRGRQRGRGLEHWINEGAKLVPPAEIDDPYRDEALRLWATEKELDWPKWTPTRAKAEATEDGAYTAEQGSLFDTVGGEAR